MNKKEELHKKHEKKEQDFYNQIKIINNNIQELETIDDKYEKTISTCSVISNEKSSNIEYTKALKASLKDSINQNDIINEQLIKIMNENEKLKKELEEKNKAIYELSQYYQYCIENHNNCEFREFNINNLTHEKRDKKRKGRKNRKRIEGINNCIREKNRTEDESSNIIYTK